MLPRLNDTYNSDNRYGGYSMNNMGVGGASAISYADNNSHYYSGVGGGIGGGGGAYSAYSAASSAYGGASAYKTYSTVNTEQVTSSQVPLTIIDPPIKQNVKSFLIWSIFNMICCGLICGLVSTIMSLRVISLADRHQYEKAQKLSDRLMLANIIITAFGALIFIIVFPYVYVAIYPSLPKINY